MLVHAPHIRNFWSAKPRCHILSPLGCSNALATSGVWHYIGAAYELQYAVDLYDNDSCFQEITELKPYWQIVRPNVLTDLSAATTDISFTMGTILAATLLSFY